MPLPRFQTDAADAEPIAAAAPTAAAAVAVIARAAEAPQTARDPPQWWCELLATREALAVREWRISHWRSQNGWLGTDYIHGEPAACAFRATCCDARAPAAHGRVSFFAGTLESTSPSGGTMCAVPDDVIGWTSVCADGDCNPWCGFTVRRSTPRSRRRSRYSRGCASRAREPARSRAKGVGHGASRRAGRPRRRSRWCTAPRRGCSCACPALGNSQDRHAHTNVGATRAKISAAPTRRRR